MKVKTAVKAGANNFGIGAISNGNFNFVEDNIGVYFVSNDD